jgi:putative membrane protein
VNGLPSVNGLPAMNADDSARMRDLLASDRTLLAWIRTAISFAGLGFAVARFGRTPSTIQASVDLGIAMSVVGALFALVGLAEYQGILVKEKPPPGAPVPARWPAAVAAVCCGLACVCLAVYLAASGG